MAPRPDGRSARAARTRGAIVDACVVLVEEGTLRPTALAVAERAGVSVRSVFQHFEDLPSLHRAVSERVVERLAALIGPADVAAPLETRVRDFVQHRAALLEAVTPFRRAANVHAPFADEIRASMRAGADYLRAEVARVFAPELRELPDSERRELDDALAMALSWPAWEALRAEAGCTVETARAATERTVRALLAAR